MEVRLKVKGVALRGHSVVLASVFEHMQAFYAKFSTGYALNTTKNMLLFQ